MNEGETIGRPRLTIAVSVFRLVVLPVMSPVVMLAQSVPPSSAMISPGFGCGDCVWYVDVSVISDPEGAEISHGRMGAPLELKHKSSMTMQLPPVPAMGVQVVPGSTGVPPDQVLVLVAGKRVVSNSEGFH